MAVTERGRYLVETAAFCGTCHNTRGADGQPVSGMELAGGRIIDDRGLAITQGMSAAVRRLAPRMSRRPSIRAQLTERDQRDLVAYLRSSLPQE